MAMFSYPVSEDGYIKLGQDTIIHKDVLLNALKRIYGDLVVYTGTSIQVTIPDEVYSRISA